MKTFKKNFVKIFMAVTAAMMLFTATGFAAPNISDILQKLNPANIRTSVLRADPSGPSIELADEAALYNALGKGASSPDTDVNYSLVENKTYDMKNYSSFIPVPEFKGNLIGNNATIQNLVIDGTKTEVGDNAGFVQKLSAGASIRNIRFIDCRIDGRRNIGTVAGESSGDISEVFVGGGAGGMSGTNAVRLSTSDSANYSNVKMGGLIGVYKNGTIKNSIFSGKMTDINLNPLPSSGRYGGVIGSNDTDNNFKQSHVSEVWWDMDSTTGVSSPVGGGKATGGATGIRINKEKEDPNDNTIITIHVNDTITRDKLISIIPTTRDVTLTVTNPASVNVLVEEQGIYKGNAVGEATVGFTVSAANRQLTRSGTVKVVANKDELKQVLDKAESDYVNIEADIMGPNKKDYSDDVYNAFKNAYNDAKTKYENSATDQTNVDAAVKALNDQITILINADKARLQGILDGYKVQYIDGNNDDYEDSSYQDFLGSYGDSVKVANAGEGDTDSPGVRRSIASLNTAVNSLRLKLGDVSIERRVHPTGDPDVMITVSGYKKAGISFNQNAKATVMIGERIVANTATVDAEGKMTVVMTKAAVLTADFNKGAVFKITVNDVDSSVNKNSEERSLTLGARPNEVIGDVKGLDLGKVDIKDEYKDLKISGIPVIYDATTGEEGTSDNPVKVDGTVVKWEFSITEELQEWHVVGTKKIEGLIADSTTGKVIISNPNNHKVFATVEVTDKIQLAAKLAEIGQYREVDYVPETWMPFNSAKQAATTVNANKDATQEEINKALEDLTDKTNKLKSQPVLTLNKDSDIIRVGDYFETMKYIGNLSDAKDKEKEVLMNKVVVTAGEGEEAVTIWKEGKEVEPLDTSKKAEHKVNYSVTNSDGVSASASMTVNVLPATGDSTNNGGGNTDGTVVDGSNTITDGNVIIDFNGKDIFSDDEIKQGVKLIVQATPVEDDSNIRAVLEKLAAVLKGEVTIDGIYDIVLYKEVNGQKTKVSNAEIKNALTVWLPISQQAVDSKDYACIHVLDNGGYDLLTGGLKEVEGKQYMGVKSKSFSEYAVVYGGGISDVAATMDTSDNTNNGNNNGNNNGGNNNNGNNNNGVNGGTNQGGGDANATNQGGGDGNTDATNQGGGDGTVTTSAVQTGDTAIILAIAATVLISMTACVIILFKKRRYNK